MGVVWVLLGGVAGLLGLLAIPVDVAISVRRDDGVWAGRVTLGWLFGLVRVRLRKPGKRARGKSGHTGMGRHGRGGSRRLATAIGTDGFARLILRLGRNLIHHIHVHDVVLRARVGLADPADTGRLWGLVGPASVAAEALPGSCIEVSPDFDAEVFDLDGSGSVRFLPVALLGAVLAFLLSPSTLRAFLLPACRSR